jgi:MFS family permease
VTAHSSGRGFADLYFYLALGAIHFHFVSYFISLVQIPRMLEGKSDWLIGLVVGGLGLSGMVARPLAGVLVDGGGRQRWLRVGAAATVLTFAGYALSPDPWVMLGFRLLHGVAMGLFTTSLLAMVTAMLPERSRGLGVGVYQSANAVAQLYAVALAVALTVLTSFEFVFMVGAGASLLAGLLGMFIVERERPVTAVVPWRRREWISRSGLAPSIVFLAMTTTFGAVQAFLPAFALERDLGNIGLFYSVYGFSLLGARSLSGALSDRIGRGQVGAAVAGDGRGSNARALAGAVAGGVARGGGALRCLFRGGAGDGGGNRGRPHAAAAAGRWHGDVHDGVGRRRGAGRRAAGATDRGDVVCGRLRALRAVSAVGDRGLSAVGAHASAGGRRLGCG